MTQEESTREESGHRPDPDLLTGNGETVSGPDEAIAADDESTVGTGSAIALGCIAGTLLLIVIGLILVAVFALAR